MAARAQSDGEPRTAIDREPEIRNAQDTGAAVEQPPTVTMMASTITENASDARLHADLQDSTRLQRVDSKASDGTGSVSALAKTVLDAYNVQSETQVGLVNSKQLTDSGGDQGREGPHLDASRQDERPVKKLHIHIPAHKLSANSPVPAEKSSAEPVHHDVGAEVPEESAFQVKEHLVGERSGTSGLVTSASLEQSDRDVGAGDLSTKKRKRPDVDLSGGSEDEQLGLKRKHVRETASNSASSSVNKSADEGDDEVGWQAKTMQHQVAHEEGALMADSGLLGPAASAMNDLAMESSTPRSESAHIEQLSAFDASNIRSGRRAAQQANERITSRQELVIDSPDGKKGKRKRRREMDEHSDTSADDSQWVQCDSCSKWRIIPSIVVNSLPKKWYCSDNLWDSKRASCDAPEQTLKEVAKEKKKRKKIQHRIRMEADAAAAAVALGVAVDSAVREPTPILEEQEVDRESPGTLERDDRPEREKTPILFVGVPDPSTHVDVPAPDTQGRRGRGRPRRVKELIKPAAEPEPSTRPQSAAGTTDETDNLEWVSESLVSSYLWHRQRSIRLTFPFVRSNARRVKSGESYRLTLAQMTFRIYGIAI